MSFFEWDMSLDVGVDQMNDQHKTLISLMDELNKKNLEAVLEKMKSLFQKTRKIRSRIN